MPSREVANAVASLLKEDQERIIALASSLRGPGRGVESTVSGGSMGTTLPQGSRIHIDMSGCEVAVGQVVAFVGGNQIIVHRVVDSGGEYVLTRGDGRVAPDSPIRRDQVLGPVSVIHDGRRAPVGAPGARRALGRAGAALSLWAAKALLRFGPGIAGVAMRRLHALEGLWRRGLGPPRHSR